MVFQLDRDDGCPTIASVLLRPRVFFGVKVLACMLAPFFAAIPSVAQTAAWTEMSKGVYSGSYSTWPKSVFMFAREPDVQTVVVPSFGGRIVHYSLHGENVLVDSPEVGEKAFYLGGHQADVQSSRFKLPAHLVLAMGKADWQHKPYTLRILGHADPALGLTMEKDIILDHETGDLALTQRIRNISLTNVSYAVWSRTFLKAGGFAVIPLNKKSRFEEGWLMHEVDKGSFVFDGERHVSLQVRKMDEFLVVFCDAEPTRVAADSNAQWLAYIYGDLLFVKYTPHFVGGNYSNNGNTVELYFDRDVAELQALSPEVELPPEGNYAFPEKWTITRLPKPVRSFKEAQKTAKGIPPPPFKH